MEQITIAILNSAILTNPNMIYTYRSISLEDAKAILKTNRHKSYVGHGPTADLLTRIFDRYIPLNRTSYIQRKGDIAIVVKLKGRIPEGAVLTLDQIKEIGYTFHLLTAIRHTDRIDTQILVDALTLPIEIDR
jgi:hypothetical protein